MPVDDVAPSLHIHYRGFYTTTSDSAPVPRVGIPARGGCHLSVSLISEMTGSHVPWKSLAHGHAAYIPVAACAELRSRTDSSQRLNAPLVLTASERFSIRLQRFACAHLREPYLTQSLPRLFPLRSPPRLLTAAARGGLKPSPDRRLRGASPHLSHSIAQPSVGRSWHTIQQRFRVFQIRRVKSFSEPVVDWSKQIPCFGCLPLPLPQLGQTRGGT